MASPPCLGPRSRSLRLHIPLSLVIYFIHQGDCCTWICLRLFISATITGVIKSQLGDLNMPLAGFFNSILPFKSSFSSQSNILNHKPDHGTPFLETLNGFLLLFTWKSRFFPHKSTRSCLSQFLLIWYTSHHALFPLALCTSVTLASLCSLSIPSLS